MKRPFTAWLFLRIRAYHSDIAETPFASVQDLNSNDRKYAYVVWKLSDDGKHLTLRGVNRNVIPKEKKDSTGIAKFLEENAKNPCLLVDRFAAECDGRIEKENGIMNGKALWVVLEAKPGKEAEVEKFLQAGQALVEAEPKTVSWFAIKIGPSRYGIFDTFADDSGRDAHLNGKVAQALMEKAAELLAKSPSIEKIDVIASKLPK